jgi:hypothetical protein
VAEQLGAIAKPDDIRFADNLPKTRSGKIMRRLLRTIASDEEITQDITTLENPAIIDQLRGKAQSPAKAKVRSRAKPKRRIAAKRGKPAKRASGKPRRKSPRRAK